MRTERVGDTDVRYQRNGSGDRALVFVHGYLDDQHVWDPVIADLTVEGVETVQLDLAGMGERTDASGPFTPDRFAAEVGSVADSLDKPVVLVGQSMGAPIVELVAAARPERTVGLVLVTPVPLAGTHLPDEVIEPFRALGGDRPGQRAIRRQLAVGLSEADLDRLEVVGGRILPGTARALADCWNNGHPAGERPSGYPGPVLVIRGADDGFVTEEMVANGTLKRFRAIETATVDHAGHWVHLEQPAVVAGLLDTFLATSTRGAGGTAQDVQPQAWTKAFDDKAADSFAAAFADDVVLEASVLTRPVESRERVKQVMEAASGIYDSLAFTQESSRGPREYLEWEATAFGGRIRGVTILVKDEQGRIVHVAIHHRPLGAALHFSSELGERLRGRIDAAHFYDGPR
ncbi:alpha/beta fold hydrolase [Streptomyces sp. NPDC091217]|uniref:alpha/beta fold hydrolase n=1 Tax=Streptomyces sp. NPDC091217 TaxID=3365975 RepID=UPI0038261A55